MITNASPFVIENINPNVDSGKFPVKREVGETFTVTATVYRDGHDLIKVMLKYRQKYGSNDKWTETPMECINPGLDTWRGSFKLEENTRFLYTVEAYSDKYQSWLKEANLKFAASQDISSELIEGLNYLKTLIEESINNAYEKNYLTTMLDMIDKKDTISEKLQIFSDSLLGDIVSKNDPRKDKAVHEPYLELIVDREKARYAAWYEIFPRSQGTESGKSSTFEDCAKRLPEIKEMGFDVLYFTPIHPIGRTKRKGPNNSLVSGPNDPGSPYAIGNELGGHKAIEPGLGAMDDFIEFEQKCKSYGMEIALDFAINCSPDHPYVKEHPEWFFVRPDGTIKYAENPPKKYEDIYPLNFYAADDKWKELWQEMKDIIVFWIEKNVRIFRVDNPHTKPVPFWHWLITEIQKDYPDVIFLSEAFTRPPMMKMLAKVGFTQSYTYFTWRNFKHELIEYLTELTATEASEYMRGNFFANTPDILPKFLQEGGRAAFKIRFVLASTLSSVYGIYSGFELCENAAVEGKEEYLNSEKYEYKVWDWDRPGNIKYLVTKLNKIRRENPALHYYKNLRFYPSDNDNIIFYGKSTEDKKNIILVVVNLDPFQWHESRIHIPIHDFGIREDETYQMNNLITNERVLLQGEKFYVSLDPHKEPAYVYRIEKWTHREEGFDYFGM
ncbi:glycosidase [Candidatus Magnetoovum chiemensis]|nr:glycosidase [Candidatus Magnetoovum chiemensis]